MFCEPNLVETGINIFEGTKRKEKQHENCYLLTSGDLASNIQNQSTNPLKIVIIGTVTKIQNGQHGPATTMGDPSRFSHKKNILPTLREQQQHSEKQSSVVPVQKRFWFGFSACWRSQFVDTANCFLCVTFL